MKHNTKENHLIIIMQYYIKENKKKIELQRNPHIRKETIQEKSGRKEHIKT